MTGTPKSVAPAVGHALAEGIKHLGDFTTSPRVLLIAGIAVVVGTAGVLTGIVLLDLIRLVHQPGLFRPPVAGRPEAGAVAARPGRGRRCRWSAA